MLTLATLLVLQIVPQEPAAREPRDFISVPAAAMDVPWWRGMPTFRFAIPHTRYNRIEALSLAAVGGWEVGEDRSLSALIRLGIADVVPNGEIEFALERDYRVRSISVYHRLAAANDWGNPLGLGSSLGALFIGRDEGFYYRAGGVEVRVVDSTNWGFDARLFAERHRSARPKNDWAFADLFGDHEFDPNIVARDGDIAGAAVVLNARRGELSTEMRLFGELKLEGAAGDFDYSRGMFEGIIAQPLFGLFLPSLTVSAGFSGGTLPIQRNWFIGGTRVARGQRAGVMAGNSFWMTQAELGIINSFARPILFFDAAWAGNRDNFSTPGRAATGAGIGVSIFDGTMRFDLARGIWPGTAWRGALYLESRL